MATLQIAFAVAYPFVVYFALGRLTPRELGIGLGALLLLRLWLLSPEVLKAATRAFWVPVVAVAVAVGATVAWNHPLGLLLTPVAVNFALLLSFAHSLRTDECMVERFARLQVDHLSEAERAYCRVVTQVWCGFFVANGGIALALALAGSLEAWTLYTGLLGYVLMGALFTVEYVYRHWRFRRYVGAFTDPLLRRLFPPDDASGTGRRDPEVVRDERSGGRFERALRVPHELECLAGHFPDVPIVPGVVQVDWAMQLIAEWTGRPPAIQGIDALKFKKPLRPGNEVTLVVEHEGGGAPFRFEFRGAEDVYSSGRIRLADPDPTP
jgi:uncharacterized membrane protein